MTRFVRLNDSISVSPQIFDRDVKAAFDAGYRTIICNRPDGESEDQPSAASIKELCRNAGMGFSFIPVGGTSFSQNYVDQMAQTIREEKGPFLAYCRSGLRSSLLWALAEVRNGGNPHTVIKTVGDVGFPVRTIRHSLGLSPAPATAAAFVNPAPARNHVH